MYYLLVEAAPMAESPAAKKFAGAFINCWVNASTPSEAESSARSWITESEWAVVNVEEVKLIDASHYDETSPNREYYEQALIDGQVYVYNTFQLEPV